MRWSKHKRLTPRGRDIHTPARPYCSRLACWCHTDAGYHARVTHPVYTRQAVKQASRFFGWSRPGAERLRAKALRGGQA